MDKLLFVNLKRFPSIMLRAQTLPKSLYLTMRVGGNLSEGLVYLQELYTSLHPISHSLQAIDIGKYSIYTNDYAYLSVGQLLRSTEEVFAHGE